MIKQLCDNEFSLLRLTPPVLRARDFRLYTRGGRRLVDLWQNGGGAILGHTPPSLLRELKNTASRGLYAPFPHFTEDRYCKALSNMLPGRNFRLYAAPPPELYALAEEGKAALWRPFCNEAAPFSVPENAPPALILVVPGIQGWRGGLPLGLCVLAVEGGNPGLPAGDFLPPVLLAAAARGIYDLIAAAPERTKLPRALTRGRPAAGRWQRQGLYLLPRQNPSTEEWAALFRLFLDGGYLLPPVSSHPVILPNILSPGEEAKLAELLSLP